MDYSKFYEIDDFKKMFYRDNNFDFQPYPTWIKTTYDLNDVVKYENLYSSYYVKGYVTARRIIG